jgi:hypothetical protein
VRFGLLFAAVFAALAIFSQRAEAAPHIYLLKGLANVFSTGLDTLADELVARGYKAEVHNYSSSGQLADEAAELQKAHKDGIIIIGHSLGADAAISMAKAMQEKGAKVLLLVTFGPDDQHAAPSNVANVINFYLGDDKVIKGPGFKGTINNVDLNGSDGINHFNVEKIERLHAKVIAKIRAIAPPQRASRKR